MTRDKVHEGHAAFEDHLTAGAEYQGEPRCRVNNVPLANEAVKEKSEVAKLGLDMVDISSPFRGASFQA